MTKNVAVFYHRADNDGMMSGVIAEYYLTPRVNSVDMIPINYGDDFEAAMPHSPSHYEDIYIIDVSDKTFMSKHGSKIIYIDHHKYAMDTMPKVRDRHCIDGVAACRLVFDYLTTGTDYLFHDKKFFVDRCNPLEPLCVALLGEFDIWDKKSVAAEMFNYGQDVKYNSVKFLFDTTKAILVSDVGPKEFNLEDINSCKNIKASPGGTGDWAYLDYIITKGVGALNYIKSTIERINPVKFSFKGMSGVYINTSIDPSLVGLSYTLKDDEDFIMVWHLNKGVNSVTASFRSSKVDVSEIARSFNGGGGHRFAAGCRMSLGQLLDLIKPQF